MGGVWDHIWKYSGVTPGSALRNHSWWGLGDFMGCWGSVPAWPHPGQMLYLLYYLLLWPTFFLYIPFSKVTTGIKQCQEILEKSKQGKVLYILDWQNQSFSLPRQTHHLWETPSRPKVSTLSTVEFARPSLSKSICLGKWFSGWEGWGEWMWLEHYRLSILMDISISQSKFLCSSQRWKKEYCPLLPHTQGSPDLAPCMLASSSQRSFVIKYLLKKFKNLVKSCAEVHLSLCAFYAGLTSHQSHSVSCGTARAPQNMEKPELGLQQCFWNSSPISLSCNAIHMPPKCFTIIKCQFYFFLLQWPNFLRENPVLSFTHINLSTELLVQISALLGK